MGRTRLGGLALLLSMSCVGGSGASCGGCAPSGYRFPEQDPSRPDAIIQEEAVRVRITQYFLDFIRPELPTVIRGALAGQSGFFVDSDDVLHVPVPSSRLINIGVASADLRDAEALLWLDDLDDHVELRFEAPNQVRLIMRNLRLGLNGKLKGDLIGSDFSCPFTGNLGPGPQRHSANVTIDAVIDPGVGPRPDQLLDVRVSLGNLALNDLDIDILGSNDFCRERECRDCAVEIFGNCIDPGGRCAECSIACDAITNTAVELVSGLLDILRPLLNDLITPIVQNIVGDTLDELNGQPAAFEDQLRVSELLGLDFIRGEPLGVFAGTQPGRFPVMDRNGLGMELTVNAGVEGPLGGCISEPPPYQPTPGPVPDLMGTDSQGRPYHVASTLSEALIDQILYAVHRSGSLCLKLSSEDVRTLTGDSFRLNASLLSILAPELADLATDTAPVLVELSPRAPGDVTLGSGAETGTDDAGNPLYDWLIQLGLRDLGVAFHVLVEDRYVRVFEVTSDVFVGMNVVIQPDNSLELALGELRIDDFQETFNELVPNADFAEVLPTILDLALGALLTESLTFDLDISNAVSDALGGAPLGLRINEILRDGAMQDYLTLSLTFTSSPSAYIRPTETRARLHEAPDLTEAWPSGEGRTTSGRIRLMVGEASRTPGAASPLEYQVRVNGGMWSVFRSPRADGSLPLIHPALRAPGRHRVELRARVQGFAPSLDPTPAIVDVVVDPFAPTLSARWTDDGLDVRARDAHTVNPGDLTVTRQAGDGGPPTGVALTVRDETSAGAVLPYDEIVGQLVRLVARDPAGNESDPLLIQAPDGVEGVATNLDDNPDSGCSARSRGGSTQLALLLLGLLVLTRRQVISR